jgi:hypothetical protein
MVRRKKMKINWKRVSDHTTVMLMLFWMVQALFVLPEETSIKEVEIVRLSTAIPTVTLTATEVASYESGLKQAALGQATQLTSWIRGLRKAKKAGILPALPNGFTDPEVIWVENRAILVRVGK